MDPMSKPYDKLPEDYQAWLRDQHPRGAQIIEANKQKFSEDQSEDEGDEIPPYSAWSKEELVKEAEFRGLSKSGNKEELVARLEAHDEEQESK